MRTLPLFSSRMLLVLSLLTAGVLFCNNIATAQSRSQYWWFRSALSASPSTISFSSVQDGSNKSVTETLTNTGRTSVTISAAKISGTGFSLSGLSLPTTLAVGHSYTFKVIFAPKTSGSTTGSVAITSTASTMSISLSGTGLAGGTLAVTPSTLSFGSVAVGATKSATGTLSASGASVVISSAGTNSSEYTMSGMKLPLTIAAGSTAQFTMTFKPASSGSAPGSASFASNAGDSTLSEALSGTGTSSGGTGSTPVHNVNLTWKESTSSVAGYNIYRGTISGGPYTKLNSSVDAATVYTDGAVTAGATYYYVTKAVNSSGTESTASNQVKAVIPTP